MKKIFVLGCYRTGTTWLGTMLCQHKEIAGILGGVEGQPGGICESAFFSHLEGHFGDLRLPNNLIQLTETFCAGTYFLSSRLDKSIFYQEKPKRYADYFQLMMDSFAAKKRKEVWVEKTPAHSFEAGRIAEYYPDARFIIVQRDILATIQSACRLEEILNATGTDVHSRLRPRKLRIVRHALSYTMYYAVLRRFLRKYPERFIWLTYKDMRRDTEGTMRRVCDFIGVNFDPAMMERRYKPDSSFQTASARKKAELDAIERSLAATVTGCWRILPFFVHLTVYRLTRHLSASRIPFWYFSLILKKYDFEDVFGEGRRQD